jgi:hypothetical protein
MKTKFKLLKQLFIKIKQTNLNFKSDIYIPWEIIYNTLLIILFVKSDLLHGFYISPTINGTILFDYDNKDAREVICLFNICEKQFSFVCRDFDRLLDYSVDCENFNISNLNKRLFNFKTLFIDKNIL